MKLFLSDDITGERDLGGGGGVDITGRFQRHSIVPGLGKEGKEMGWLKHLPSRWLEAERAATFKTSRLERLYHQVGGCKAAPIV